MYLDQQNENIFEHAKRTADMLVKMFGSSCEVAVHNFSNLEESLIYVAGNVTKRRIGGPVTDLVLKEIKKPSSEILDISNYKTTFSNGITMKSSTVFLRDSQGEVIGALCVNFKLNFLLTMEEELKDFIHTEQDTPTLENFYTSVTEVIEVIVERAVQSFNKLPTELTMDEKIELVRILDEKGMFLVKGSTEYLSSILGVSKFTIYTYLQKLRTIHDYSLEKRT
jgi:predicted transcriptional regulator YheO